MSFIFLTKVDTFEIIQLLLIMTGSVFSARMFSTVIHEAGHAIPGYFFSKGPIEIYIGTYGEDNTGTCFRIGNRITVYFKYHVFYTGRGVCFIHDKIDSVSKNFLISLGGPFMSLLIAFVTFYLFFYPGMHDLFRLSIAYFFTSAILDFFVNITPSAKAISTKSGDSYNDGFTLYLLYTYKNIWNEMVEISGYYNNKEYRKGIDFFLSRPDITHKGFLKTGVSLYLSVGNYSEAKKLLDVIFSHDHSSGDYYLHYGTFYCLSGEFEKSIELLGKAIRKNSSNVAALTNRGYCFLETGRYEEANTDLNHAIYFDSRSVNAYNTRALLRFKTNRIAEGINDIKISLEIEPENAYAWKYLGIHHLETQAIEKAHYCFSKAKESDPYTTGIDQLLSEATVLLKESR